MTYDFMTSGWVRSSPDKGTDRARYRIDISIDIVVAGSVSVLNVVAVEDLEYIARLRELGRQPIVDDIAELDGKHDVLLLGVIDDPLQSLREDLRIVAILVEEILRVGNDSNAEFLPARGSRVAPSDPCAACAVTPRRITNNSVLRANAWINNRYIYMSAP
jgi:hypothetical protein